MADLLAEATQEPTAQDGRRRNRVVESSDEDDDQPQSKRSKRRRAARDAENEEEHEEREEGEHEDGGQEALDDLNGWTIATFADKPVGNSSYTHKAVSYNIPRPFKAISKTSLSTIWIARCPEEPDQDDYRHLGITRQDPHRSWDRHRGRTGHKEGRIERSRRAAKSDGQSRIRDKTDIASEWYCYPDVRCLRESMTRSRKA